VKDPDQRRAWVEDLSQYVAGHDTFLPPGAKENAKPLSDPCADTIKSLLESQTP
jgi:hypothetical protein